MNKLHKKLVAGGLAVVMALTMGNTSASITKAEESTTIHNPQIGAAVIWDCIYYGSYPQTEITKETNSDVYDSLQNAVDWDENGDIVIENEKYRRIQKKDATSTAASYVWEKDEEYHYFQYEPIKWRVLEVKDKEAYLVSDKILDTQKFNQKARAVTWESSTLRSWLNGLSATENTAEIDYSKKGFIDIAFTSEEQEQLLNTGKEKIELLTEGEVTKELYAGYGLTFEAARNCQSSDYAKAMGAAFNEKGFSNWWLADSGNTELTARYVQIGGEVYNKGYSIAYNGNGVRVAIHFNCQEEGQYSYAGTVSSDGTCQTPTPTVTPISTPVVTITGEVPATPTILTNTPTPTKEVSPTPTEGAPTVSASPTPTEGTPTASASPTLAEGTPTGSASPTPAEGTPTSINPSPTSMPTQTPLPTETPMPTETPLPTETPMPTETPVPTATLVPTITLEPTETPIPTETPLPTETPTPTETPVPTATLVPTITLEPTETPTPTETLIPTTIPTKILTPTVTIAPTKTPTPTKVPTVKKGTIYKDEKTKAVYKVTKAAAKTSGTVQYVKPTSSNITTVTIPATIKINGKTYKVTSIASKALQKKQKLKKVVIGKNVSAIGKNAFYGCEKLKTIQIKTTKLKAKKVGKNAFKGIYKKAKIKVPAKKQKAYKKILKASGAGEEVKITK